MSDYVTPPARSASHTFEPAKHGRNSSSEQTQDEKRDPWNVSLIKSLVSSLELDKLDINPRRVLIEPWLLSGDLGFIFAKRGVGKTWLGIHLAYCLSEGRDCGPWKISLPCKVLYMDGEMPLQDVQHRNHVLGKPNANLVYLSHEVLFDRTGRILNLSDADLQKAVIELTTSLSFDVLILDNLSTLVSGVDENKSIDWEKILPWLLKLRRSHITVIFIHHAGRSGEMRGSSKREDPSAWIINLKPPKNDPEQECDGASFISSFEKCRNAPQHPKDLCWNFTPLPNDEILVRFEDMNPMDVFLDLVAHGMNNCAEIAEEMEFSKASVTRLAQKAEISGFIEIKKRKYYIKTTGSASTPYNPSDD